ncbi:hypothetical protein GJ744_011100 [Endocarpon pusillum]|uniref:Uncharacterized protein n=1 Tax=Endocarpon pusillum TaxID=364733 RepID=A0A8H7AF73_9EURO|nr:hypothetical protein GJ744_011100 [Endocarpon pusillum]
MKELLAGWRRSGLLTSNQYRVLADTLKNPAEITVPKADEVKVRVCPQDEVLPTPLTPVLVEALTSLLDMKVPQDETSEQHKERLHQKVANAAHTSFAKNALLQDRNQFLTTINNEGKVRRSTKSEILRKARVTSFEDLEKARAERAAKEAAKGAKKAAKEAKKVMAAAPEIKEAPRQYTKWSEAQKCGVGGRYASVIG